MKKSSRSKLSPDEAKRIKAMVPTIDELRIIDLMRDYRAIRKNYYGNSIPPVEKMLIRFFPREEIVKLSGYDDEHTDGLSCWGKYKGFLVPTMILLPDDLKICETRISLLHETAHIKVNLKFGRNMGHGKNFDREIRRLAAVGAYDGWL